MVFALLLASFVVAGMLDGLLARLITLLFYVGVLVLALRFARLPIGTARWLRRALLAGSVLIAVLVLVLHGRVIEGIAALWTAGFLLLTVFVVVGRVLRHPVVTMQTIFGALSAYLMVGFVFVALFTAAARLGPGQFFTGDETADGDSIQYFAFVTLTTTGYGDLTPATAPGRSLAVLDALCGQIFLVTLVARLVSVFGVERRRPGDDAAA
ncbi:potassium channel family protein [Actinoplanes sp. NPDC026623]|uniref:potassium channel family protein n=1 Tax=Actinoplanes sp. NPDC026623 TaxID=3155610 RepID=UPI0033C56C5D